MRRNVAAVRRNLEVLKLAANFLTYTWVHCKHTTLRNKIAVSPIKFEVDSLIANYECSKFRKRCFEKNAFIFHFEIQYQKVMFYMLKIPIKFGFLPRTFLSGSKSSLGPGHHFGIWYLKFTFYCIINLKLILQIIFIR